MTAVALRIRMSVMARARAMAMARNYRGVPQFRVVALAVGQG